MNCQGEDSGGTGPGPAPPFAFGTAAAPKPGIFPFFSECSPDIRGGGAVQRGCFSVAVLFCKWVPERTENFFFWLFCYAPLNEAGAEPRLAGLTVDALQLPFSIPPAVFLSLAPALLFLLRSKVRPDAGFLI